MAYGVAVCKNLLLCKYSGQGLERICITKKDLRPSAGRPAGTEMAVLGIKLETEKVLLRKANKRRSWQRSH